MQKSSFKMGIPRISQITVEETKFLQTEQNPIYQLGGEIPCPLPRHSCLLSRMRGSTSSSSSLAPALKLIRLLTDPLQLHPRRNTIFFLSAWSIKCTKPQADVERTLWWQWTQRPPGATWCKWRAGCQGALPDRRPGLAQGAGQKGLGRSRAEKLLSLMEATCYNTSSLSFLSQPSTQSLSREALTALAVVIQDIPVPHRAGTNQPQGWQKGQRNHTSDATKWEVQYLRLKSLRNSI